MCRVSSKTSVSYSLPHNSPGGLLGFWIGYWIGFLSLLPFMLLRQIFLSAYNFLSALATWNRSCVLLRDARGAPVLEIHFLNSAGSILATTLFGERFLAVRYFDILLDPGPVFARRDLLRRLKKASTPVQAIALTHRHEEHSGNAGEFASEFRAPIWGSSLTLKALLNPEALTIGRMSLMGQPSAQNEVRGIACDTGTLQTEGSTLQVIESAGHCFGHISFYDPQNKILFAGDSYLHDEFTSPNKDVDSDRWLSTLDRYLELDIQTMIGAHGVVYTRDPRIAARAFVVEHADPIELIRRKRDFLLAARATVAEGEERGLSYSVIECCLFPWHKSWTWKNWFNDESFRLFSFGEFSRTHFVRSLSRTPERVPERFPPFNRMIEFFGLLDPAHTRALVRIHLLAGQVRNPYTILAGLLLSVLALRGSAHWLAPEAPQTWNPFDLGAYLLSVGEWDALLLAGLGLALIWATLGAAITRQMALDIHRQTPENFLRALRFCVYPAMFAPSTLASMCLLIIFCVPHHLLALIAVLPLWLFAGFLYSQLTLERLGVADALRRMMALRSQVRYFFRLQMRFLLGFFISTGFVYFATGFFVFVWWTLLRPWEMHPLRGWPLAITELIGGYALGYTTANLKSLQIYLAQKLLGVKHPPHA